MLKLQIQRMVYIYIPSLASGPQQRSVIYIGLISSSTIPRERSIPVTSLFVLLSIPVLILAVFVLATLLVALAITIVMATIAFITSVSLCLLLVGLPFTVTSSSFLDGARATARPRPLLPVVVVVARFVPPLFVVLVARTRTRRPRARAHWTLRFHRLLRHVIAIFVISFNNGRSASGGFGRNNFVLHKSRHQSGDTRTKSRLALVVVGRDGSTVRDHVFGSLSRLLIGLLQLSHDLVQLVRVRLNNKRKTNTRQLRTNRLQTRATSLVNTLQSAYYNADYYLVELKPHRAITV